MDSKNESKLTKIRKPPLLLNEEKSLAEKVKKYLCLFDKSQKSYKKRDGVKNTCEALPSELHFIEDVMQYVTQFIS